MTPQEMTTEDLESQIIFYEQLVEQEENNHFTPFGLKMEQLYKLDNKLAEFKAELAQREQSE